MNANMPIWNIRTHSPIIVGHNGFETEYIQTFIRQLHTDATTYFSMGEEAPDFTAKRADRRPSTLVSQISTNRANVEENDLFARRKR